MIACRHTSFSRDVSCIAFPTLIAVGWWQWPSQRQALDSTGMSRVWIVPCIILVVRVTVLWRLVPAGAHLQEWHSCVSGGASDGHLQANHQGRIRYHLCRPGAAEPGGGTLQSSTTLYACKLLTSAVQLWLAVRTGNPACCPLHPPAVSLTAR